MKKIVAATAALLLATSLSAPAHAAVTFTLTGVTFADGTSASGSFTTDDLFTSVTDFAVTTQAGTFSFFLGGNFPVDGVLFTSANDIAFLTSQSVAFVKAGFLGYDRTLTLDFDLLALGTVEIASGAEYEFLFGRAVTSGSLEGVTVPTGPGGGGPNPGGAVPEPATWAMMIGGIGAAGGALRRRKAKVSVRFA